MYLRRKKNVLLLYFMRQIFIQSNVLIYDENSNHRRAGREYPSRLFLFFVNWNEYKCFLLISRSRLFILFRNLIFTILLSNNKLMSGDAFDVFFFFYTHRYWHGNSLYDFILLFEFTVEHTRVFFSNSFRAEIRVNVFREIFWRFSFDISRTLL